MLPERLNLAIGRRCYVSCKGCYQAFGKSEPDLRSFLKSIKTFVSLGLTRMTVSGGDPLTIAGLKEFLADMRSSGVTNIKIDTVGSGFQIPEDNFSQEPILPKDLQPILSMVDYIGLPLDGWSNESVGLFRYGRPKLYEETCNLLTRCDALAVFPMVVINTVVHELNRKHIHLLAPVVGQHASVCRWNLFQYTPTDRAPNTVNAMYSLTFQSFCSLCESIRSVIERHSRQFVHISVMLHSVHSRLGRYLLINSDGNAWLPDEYGKTIELGKVFGREVEVLKHWDRVVLELLARVGGSTPPMEVATGTGLERALAV